MTQEHGAPSIVLLLVTDDAERSIALCHLVQLVLPRASIAKMDAAAAMENELPSADAALVDASESSRIALDTVRFLRARSFNGAIVVLVPSAADPVLLSTAQSLGVTCMTRGQADRSPAELGAALTSTMSSGAAALAEVVQARRIFAAGQAALSLQHSINNPLAALLAEAQLLQMEELPKEQREAVDRIIELCRRMTALVRRLDVLASS